jgi:hypothetical protein
MKKLDKAIITLDAIQRDKLSKEEAEALQLVINDYKRRYNLDGRIKTCKVCHKTFIAKRSDAIYCGDCSKKAATLVWQEKVKDETTWNCWYRRVYQSFQMRVKRNPDKPLLKENFDQFRREAAKWKMNVKNGTTTSEEFIMWLKDTKKYL